MSEGGDIIVASFAKNQRERVRVALGTYRGVETAGVRLFARTESGDVPTRAGLTIRRELLPELAAALVAAVKAAGLTLPSNAQEGG